MLLRGILWGHLLAQAGVWQGGCGGAFTPVSMSAHSPRDYSAPVNFISAGLKKGAAEEAELDDSEDEEKPGKQEELPKDLGPKKLKTVESPSRGWAAVASPGRGTWSRGFLWPQVREAWARRVSASWQGAGTSPGAL